MSSSTTRRMRKIVRIDEEKCNGCGDCVPSCAEGAIKIIDGKARLVADNLCDGLGACLGHCPMDAISIEEREAEEFDERAVEMHLGKPAHDHAPQPAPVPASQFIRARTHAGGCPGSRVQSFQAMPAMPNMAGAPTASALRQWPVQLALLPVTSAIWQDSDLLIAADCVPFAYPAFHSQLLAGKALAIACPKLDDVEPYLHKLSAIFTSNRIKSVTVARMEVPCCSGLTRVVQRAIAQSGKVIPMKEIIIGIRGDCLPA